MERAKLIAARNRSDPTVCPKCGACKPQNSNRILCCCQECFGKADRHPNDVWCGDCPVRGGR